MIDAFLDQLLVSPRIGNNFLVCLPSTGGSRNVKTPNFVLATARALPPHLTPDMLDKVSELRAFNVASGDVLPLMKPLRSFAQFLASDKQHTSDSSSSKDHAPAQRPASEVAKIASHPFHTMAQLENHAILLSLRNPVTDTNQFPNSKTPNVFTDRGQIPMPPTLFMDIVKTLKPDFVHLMSDETPPGASSAKVDKMVKKNGAWLDECLKVMAPAAPASTSTSTSVSGSSNDSAASNNETKQALISSDFEGPVYFASAEGGNFNDRRTAHAKKLAAIPQLGGFVVSGFTSAPTSRSRQDLCAATVAGLPEDKPRLVSSVGDPVEVLDALDQGVDLFASAYPLLLTEHGLAAVFPITMEELKAAIADGADKLAGRAIAKAEEAAVAAVEAAKAAREETGEKEKEPKREPKKGRGPQAAKEHQQHQQHQQKQETKSNEADAMVDVEAVNKAKADAVAAAKAAAVAQRAEMTRMMAEAESQPFLYENLRRYEYREDPTPLLVGCDCYACVHHTKGYINHLLNANEMLSETLLMLHNTHHYAKLFAQARTAIADGSFETWSALARQVYVPHKPIAVNKRKLALDD